MSKTPIDNVVVINPREANKSLQTAAFLKRSVTFPQLEDRVFNVEFFTREPARSGYHPQMQDEYLISLVNFQRNAEGVRAILRSYDVVNVSCRSVVKYRLTRVKPGQPAPAAEPAATSTEDQVRALLNAALDNAADPFPSANLWLTSLDVGASTPKCYGQLSLQYRPDAANNNWSSLIEDHTFSLTVEYGTTSSGETLVKGVTIQPTGNTGNCVSRLRPLGGGEFHPADEELANAFNAFVRAYIQRTYGVTLTAERIQN